MSARALSITSFLCFGVLALFPLAAFATTVIANDTITISAEVPGGSTPPPQGGSGTSTGGYYQPPSVPFSFACSDGIDNDGDGFVDFGQDPDCTSNLGTSETGISIPSVPPPVQQPVVPTTPVVPDSGNGVTDGSPVITVPVFPGLFPQCVGDACIPNAALTVWNTAYRMLSGIATTLLAVAVAANLPSILFRLNSLLATWLGLRRRRKDWGAVYDSVTKQPLDPAYVVLQTAAGHEAGTAITDIDGRYGFLTVPGIYRIKAGKTHYVFPSRILAGKGRDELYDNLYFGEEIEIKRNDDVITRNIPMDPVETDWNEVAKRAQRRFSFFRKADIALYKFLNIVFWIGFGIAALAFILFPTGLNLLIFLLYLGMLLLRFFEIGGRKYGIVRAQSGKPLAFAIIRIFLDGSKREVQHKVTDALGRYYALVPRGSYYVTVERKNADGSYTHTFTSPVLHARNGILKHSLIAG